MFLDFPSPIGNDSDLEFYENYLKQEFKTAQHSTFVEYLKRYIGFTLKIDCAISNRIDTKIGKLTEVGEDFILLNIAPTNQKTMVRLGNVKFVTILKK